MKTDQSGFCFFTGFDWRRSNAGIHGESSTIFQGPAGYCGEFPQFCQKEQRNEKQFENQVVG
jgi:hypothetical protein